jgi:hypothetical protein
MHTLPRTSLNAEILEERRLLSTLLPSGPALVTSTAPASSAPSLRDLLSSDVGVPSVSTAPTSTVPATPVTTPNPLGTPPSTPATQTIGLLAFSATPTYPVGAAYFGPAPSTVPVDSKALTQSNQPNPPASDETPPADDEATEPRTEQAPPAGNGAAPQSLPSQRPPADDSVSRQHAPASLRASVVHEFLEHADDIQPTEIVVGEGWGYGLAAAGFIGTLVPELSSALKEGNDKERKNRSRLTAH